MSASVGVESQRLAQPSALGVFSRRVDDALVVVDILGLIIMYFLSPQRLGQCGLPRCAAAHEHQLFHVFVISQTVWLSFSDT